jgi:glycerophosphoryl diester phosphodiesterase
MGYEQIIWTLYRYGGNTVDVLKNVMQMSLFAVTMPTDRAQAGLARELDQLFIPSYVHTINSLKDADRYFELGIDGLYTDVLTEDMLTTLKRQP